VIPCQLASILRRFWRRAQIRGQHEPSHRQAKHSQELSPRSPDHGALPALPVMVGLCGNPRRLAAKTVPHLFGSASAPGLRRDDDWRRLLRRREGATGAIPRGARRLFIVSIPAGGRSRDRAGPPCERGHEAPVPDQPAEGPFPLVAARARGTVEGVGSTSSIGTASSWAAICAKVVWFDCPCVARPVPAVASAANRLSWVPCSGEPAPEPWRGLHAF
jgi:hypothetical protein